MILTQHRLHPRMILTQTYAYQLCSTHSINANQNIQNNYSSSLSPMMNTHLLNHKNKYYFF